jgi:hypothetical protein
MSAEQTQPEQPAADVVTIPSRGFARGAIVHRRGSTRNMLVVRGLGETTACIVIESDTSGSVRLREFPTSDLTEVLVSGSDQSASEAPILPWLAGDEDDRMAREAARDCYKAVLSQLKHGGGVHQFGVQHVGGRITLTVDIAGQLS